jgi:CRP-like cAMP-binding protein
MVATEILEALHFLRGVAEEHVRRIAEIAEMRDIPAGNVVFREGDVISHVYLVATGRVSLEIRVPGRPAVQIQTIGPGELLGWSPILDAGPMTATARATIPSRLVTLHAAQLGALCRHAPQLGTEIMRRTALALAERLNATRLQLLDVYRHELPVVQDWGGSS